MNIFQEYYYYLPNSIRIPFRYSDPFDPKTTVISSKETLYERSPKNNEVIWCGFERNLLCILECKRFPREWQRAASPFSGQLNRKIKEVNDRKTRWARADCGSLQKVNVPLLNLQVTEHRSRAWKPSIEVEHWSRAWKSSMKTISKNCIQ